MKYKFFDVDFETRSEVDLKKVGAYAYAKHPSTEILIIGYKFDGWEVQDYDPWFSLEKQLRKFIKRVNELLKKGYKMRAFNSMFELLIWNFVGIRQFGFPKLMTSQTYCVMAESCAMGYPAALENAAKALQLIDQKEKSGTALINFFSKPSRAKGEYFKDPLQHEERFMEFKSYCQQDVIVQIAISNRLLKLTPFQYATFIMTEKMNLRGLPIDLDMVKGALALDSGLKDKANKGISELTNGKVSSASQATELTKWFNSKGCEIPNMKAGTIEKWLRKRKLKSKFRKVLKLRVEGSKSSTAKYKKAFGYLTDKNRVHDFLKYHIAHTGRWGGRGIQIQNFSKPEKDFKSIHNSDKICELISNKASLRLASGCGSVSSALKAVTRGMICAPKGYKFVAADYAQIEARIVMWLANSFLGLRDFAGDGKIYENMAATIFNKLASKIKKPSFERDLGKATVLGCGFGMGWPKFVITCLEKMGLKVSEQLAQTAVKTFRKRYHEVPKSWKECERAFIKAYNEPGVMFSACNEKLNFIFEGENLFMILPSGRKLCYPQVVIVDELDNWGNLRAAIYYYTWNYQAPGNKWVKHKLWGGVVFQNGVQAIAADIMNAGMIKAESTGYFTLFTVHDEAVSLVQAIAIYSYQEYEKLLAKYLPGWAKGLKVIAEGWEGPRYRK